jgi:hypothetical protein
MPTDRDDDRLLAELGAAVRDAAGLPASFLAAGRAALRSLTFTGSDVTLEIQVRSDALVGQLVPPAPGELDVRTSDGEVRTVEVDEVGWFVVEPPPKGLVSLYVRSAGVATEWTAL